MHTVCTQDNKQAVTQVEMPEGAVLANWYVLACR